MYALVVLFPYRDWAVVYPTANPNILYPFYVVKERGRDVASVNTEVS